MRQVVGSVIPVWVPAEMPPETVLGFLRATLADVELFVAPQRLVLVVDGCPAAEEPARQAAAEVAERAGAGPQMLMCAANGGKGAAVCAGLERLLEDEAVEALNIRDCDADHDIYDLPQLFRLFEHVREHLRAEGSERADRLFAVGCRGTLTRPMGAARGHLEAVLNRLTVEAVNARLAEDGSAVDERFTARYGRVIDFQSGYKLYSRAAAQVVIEALRAADAAEPELRVMRWAVEFIPTVELLLRGFTPAALYRLTWDGQPQTTFDGSDLPRAYSQQIAWLFARLGTPAGIGLRLLDNELEACEYLASPHGPEHLATIRAQVVGRCWPDATTAMPPVRGTLFI